MNPKLWDVAVHEGRHTAMTLWTRRPVAHVWVARGSSLPGETAGFTSAPIPGEIGLDQLMISLAGYMGTGKPGWPPSYEQAKKEPLEGLNKIIEYGGIDQQTYERAVELTREILADNHFQALRDSIARALLVVPYLDEEGVLELAEANNIPVQRQVEEKSPC
jgi:hypothetical protein